MITQLEQQQTCDMKSEDIRYWPSIMGLSAGPAFTVKGQCFMSSWMLGSWYLRPIRRFASKIVLTGFIATCIYKNACELLNTSYNKIISCSRDKFLWSIDVFMACKAHCLQYGMHHDQLMKQIQITAFKANVYIATCCNIAMYSKAYFFLHGAEQGTYIASKGIWLIWYLLTGELGSDLILGCVSHKPLIGKSYEARCCTVAHIIGDDLHSAILPDTNAAVLQKTQRYFSQCIKSWSGMLCSQYEDMSTTLSQHHEVCQTYAKTNLRSLHWHM